MTRAAAPAYLGDDFATAAPGHRFGMYLRLWERRDWTLQKTGKTAALKDTLGLNEADRQLSAALAMRQDALADSLASTGELLLRIAAVATSPFTTGVGNEHPLENGFSFLNPYGLPYLPGSGVKGVVRAAAGELASGAFGSTEGWTDAAINALFGLEAKDGSSDHRRGVLTFWDVLPQIKGDVLRADVLTPHQSHYYQGNESPHDSGSPVPIVFVTVPPGSSFAFHVRCDRVFLDAMASHLLEGGQWRVLMQAALSHAFSWLGFGAKSAVGYGAFREKTIEEAAAAIADKLRCPWVDDTIKQIAAKDRVADLSQVLRGRRLAEAWHALSDQDFKQRALADIRARWTKAGWWSNPPGPAGRKAFDVYKAGS